MKLVISTTSRFKRLVFNFLVEWYHLTLIHNVLGRGLRTDDTKDSVINLYRLPGEYTFEAHVVNGDTGIHENGVYKATGCKPTFKEAYSILRSMFKQTHFYQTLYHGKTYLFNYCTIRKMKRAAANYHHRIQSEVWLEDEGCYRWEGKEATPDYPRRVVTAANRYGDYIVVGARHHCKLMDIQTRTIGMKVLRAYSYFYGGDRCEEQGFVCNSGMYLTRQEAMVLARARDQFFGYYKEPHALAGNTLYSEIIH